MSKSIKSKVNEFVKRHSLKKIDYASLCRVAEELGFTIIEFTSLLNDVNVEIIIRNLQLENAIKYSRGFTYSDKNYRLIFINGDLNEREKTLLLSHELGHIASGHMNTHAVIGNDVSEEHAANEFSHYLMEQGALSKLGLWFSGHKKAVFAVTALTAVTVTGAAGTAVVQKNRSYYGEYYATPSGSKYHEAQCIFIKDKTTARRLTQEEFETGEFEACGICLPD